MLGFLKGNPIKKLEKRYNALLEKAMHAQRNGNIALYAELSAQSDTILKQIKSLEDKEAQNE